MSDIPENLKDKLKTSYDAIAEKYNAWTEQHSTTRLDAINNLLPRLSTTEPISILELGCGGGIPITKLLAEQANYNIVANDLSTKQIEIARQNLGTTEKGNVRFAPGDMLALSLPSGGFDAVLGFYSIIHLPRDEQLVLFEKIMGWLKPGGYFLANFSEEALPSVVMEEWLDEKGWMFWSGWGAVETVTKLKTAGFEILETSVKKDVVDASFLWVLARKPLT